MGKMWEGWGEGFTEVPPSKIRKHKRTVIRGGHEGETRQ
jgi:hypothetical protein